MTENRKMKKVCLGSTQADEEKGRQEQVSKVAQSVTQTTFSSQNHVMGCQMGGM